MQNQTPNTDPIQEQPDQQEPIFTEIQHPNVSMTLHKILIYFLLWFWAVLRLFECFSEFVILDLGEPLVEGGPPLTAQFFLWIAVLLNLALAVFCIVTRFKLAKLAETAFYCLWPDSGDGRAGSDLLHGERRYGSGCLGGTAGDECRPDLCLPEILPGKGLYVCKLIPESHTKHRGIPGRGLAVFCCRQASNCLI